MINWFITLIKFQTSSKHYQCDQEHFTDCNFLQVNGEVFDLDRVLEGDCTLEFLRFEDDEGETSMWHYLSGSTGLNFQVLVGKELGEVAGETEDP